MPEIEEEAQDWLAEARLTLAAAGEMLAGDHGEEVITSSFLAMVYAARAALGGKEDEISGWEDVVRLFQVKALPELGLSKENQRSLPIVGDLYRRVVGGVVEADPITAAACFQDASSFIAELASKL